MNSLDLLIKEVASTLKKNHWYLTTAESCTGGMLASCLTEMPGSSAWFERGFVTYSNLSKEELLSVPQQLIKKQGAVSESVALAMAIGGLEHSASDIAVAITGIAGPDGGSISKPVGTVCFGFAGREMQPRVLRKQLKGSRQEIRLRACQEALSELLVYLLL